VGGGGGGDEGLVLVRSIVSHRLEIKAKGNLNTPSPLYVGVPSFKVNKNHDGVPSFKVKKYLVCCNSPSRRDLNETI